SKYSIEKPLGTLQPFTHSSIGSGSYNYGFYEPITSSRRQIDDMGVVDRLLKYAHFIALASKFTTASLANRLFPSHLSPGDLAKTSLSNRDRLFLSQLWLELFCLGGTTISYSSAYHPQIDGQ
ncbi:UNVERIFIED_CONTAM: hypothetical protein Sradi_5105800, partial [Sesamum radiatum]